jgi:hypothetical protein
MKKTILNLAFILSISGFAQTTVTIIDQYGTPVSNMEFINQGINNTGVRITPLFTPLDQDIRNSQMAAMPSYQSPAYYQLPTYYQETAPVNQYTAAPLGAPYTLRPFEMPLLPSYRYQQDAPLPTHRQNVPSPTYSSSIIVTPNPYVDQHWMKGN